LSIERKRKLAVRGFGKIKLKGILKEGILDCFAQPAKQSLILL